MAAHLPAGPPLARARTPGYGIPGFWGIHREVHQYKGRRSPRRFRRGAARRPGARWRPLRAAIVADDFRRRICADGAGLSYADLAARVLAPFVGDALTSDELAALVKQAYRDFDHARGRAAAPTRSRSVAVGTVPRADAGVQGLRPATGRTPVRPHAHAPRRARDNRRRDVRRHRVGRHRRLPAQRLLRHRHSPPQGPAFPTYRAAR